jgi:hypothetical protein
MLSFREMITSKIKGNVIIQPVDNTNVIIHPVYNTDVLIRADNETKY